ncbi:MAG TPA: DUF4362 domain-containing protein [Candidatus Bathyarchaeia archaeon]|nr:DUF4362 domain-containing protein [Candidatus Bathyarchaeia archaeon]
MAKRFVWLYMLMLCLTGCGTTPNPNAAQHQETVTIKRVEQEPVTERKEVDRVYVRLSNSENVERFFAFLERYQVGEADQIEIQHFTIEGDPIITTLNYDGKQIFFTYDDSQDRYGAQEKGVRQEVCKEIVHQEEDGKTSYYVTNCSDDAGGKKYFLIHVPSKS